MKVVGDIARLNAKRYPNRKALIKDGDYVTFDQLNKKSNQLAHGLLAMGIKPGDKISVLADNCIEYVIVQYAIAKCGGVCVPVNFRYRKYELIHVINKIIPKALFFGPEFISLVSDAHPEFIPELHLITLSGECQVSDVTYEKLMNGQSASDPELKIDPESPYLITFTSGTTGSPKAVLASHAGCMNVYIGMTLEGDLGHGEISLVTLPLFHTGGMHAHLQPTLLLGGTAVILGRGFNADRFFDAIERFGITMTMLAPTMLAMLISHPNIKKYNLTTLKKIWYGSSAIRPNVLEASRQIFNADFFQWYGQTETGMVAVLRPEDHLEHLRYTGREFFNADLKVVDSDGKDVAIGEIGELISSQTPLGMIGYLESNEANDKTIRDGWIYTGDLARVEGNGFFTIVDRLKDMIISGAENIYPKEIEDAICKHPAVQEAAVFGVPDEIYGESVCAVIVRKEGRQIEQEDVINFCASQLSSYKKPKKVEFANELPKNATGKVTKNVLREPFWKGMKIKI